MSYLCQKNSLDLSNYSIRGCQQGTVVLSFDRFIYWPCYDDLCLSKPGYCSDKSLKQLHMSEGRVVLTWAMAYMVTTLETCALHEECDSSFWSKGIHLFLQDKTSASLLFHTWRPEAPPELMFWMSVYLTTSANSCKRSRLFI